MKKPAVLAVLALLALGAPALAGNVLIPLASNRSVDGVIYRTRIWISNPSGADRKCAATFIEQGTDGSATPPFPGSIVVPAGGTVALTAGAPDGKTGMLEIAGAAQLLVTARLEAVSSEGTVLSSAAVPAVSAANALAPGAVAHLQGLHRGGGAATNFSLLNLSRQPAQCTVRAFRSDSSQISRTATLSLPALGKRDFDQVFTILGERQIADARFEATCDQPFFTYATVLQPAGTQSVFVQPSPSLAGAAVAGGGPGGPPPGGGPGSVSFTVPGTFLNATDSNSEAVYDLPAQPGVSFNRATIEFDLKIRGFSDILLFTGVHSFRRPNDDRNKRVVYYAVQIVNKNAKTVLDLGIQDVLVKTTGPWTSGHTYHLKFTYDVPQRNVQLDVSENGQQVYTISGPAQHLDLSANDRPLRVDFGQTGIGDGAYGPPIGWSYANLSVLLEP